MKKKLLLIICILMITGCKVEYNLMINNDLTISESVKMTGTDSFFDNYYKSSQLNVVEMLFNEERKNFLKENGYVYEIVDESKPYVLATKKYNDINEYASNSVFFAQYFEKISISLEDGIVNIKTNDFYSIDPDSLEQYNIQTTSIKIKSLYEVTNNNASVYDEKTNTYTWYIDRETTDFSLEFSYDTNKIYKVPVDNTNLYMILGTIVVIVLVIIFAFYKSREKSK